MKIFQLRVAGAHRELQRGAGHHLGAEHCGGGHTGLHGGHRVCQVHQAGQQSGDHPLQQERPHLHEERLLLPSLQDRRPEVRMNL